MSLRLREFLVDHAQADVLIFIFSTLNSLARGAGHAVVGKLGLRPQQR